MEKILLIDDERNMGAPIIARTFEAGVYLLKVLPQLDELWLDNDLGPMSGYNQEGRHILDWFEKESVTDPDFHKFKPKKLWIVTSNTVAREIMETVARKLYKYQTDQYFHD